MVPCGIDTVVVILNDWCDTGAETIESLKKSAGECTAAAFLLPLLFLPTLVNTVAFTDNDY